MENLHGVKQAKVAVVEENREKVKDRARVRELPVTN
jgi:hypothetical protein